MNAGENLSQRWENFKLLARHGSIYALTMELNTVTDLFSPCAKQL